MFHVFLPLSLRANASLRGNPVSCIPYLYSQTGSPQLRRAMTKVCKSQVQEATRTQWIPACAGMTTVFNFLSLRHRHTGAGRYPMFRVFLPLSLRANASLRGNPVSCIPFTPHYHLQKIAERGKIYGVQKKNNCRIQWDDCFRQYSQKFNPRFLHFLTPTLCRI